jgi:hypothetical protein
MDPKTALGASEDFYSAQVTFYGVCGHIYKVGEVSNSALKQ